MIDLGQCIERAEIYCNPGSLPICTGCYRVDICGNDVAADLFNTARQIEIPLETVPTMYQVSNRTADAVSRRILI